MVAEFTEVSASADRTGRGYLMLGPPVSNERQHPPHG
jgi:hypothetical protein